MVACTEAQIVVVNDFSHLGEEVIGKHELVSAILGRMGSGSTMGLEVAPAFADLDLAVSLGDKEVALRARRRVLNAASLAGSSYPYDREGLAQHGRDSVMLAAAVNSLVKPLIKLDESEML